MKLLNAMMVSELTETVYGVYNGIGQENIDHSKSTRIEVKYCGDIFYLPISGIIKKKDFPELKSLFTSEFYGEAKEVKDPILIEKIKQLL